MSYRSDMSVPLAPLREIKPGNGGLHAEHPAVPEGSGNSETAARPVELEPTATREGGTDLSPKLVPLRTLSVDRPPDELEMPDAHAENEKGRQGQPRGTLALAAVWVVLGVFFVWLYFQFVPLFTFAMSCHGWRLYVAFTLLAIPISVLAVIMIYVVRIFRALPKFEQIKDSRGSSFEVKNRLLREYLDKLPAARRYVASVKFDGPAGGEVVKILGRLTGETESHYSDEVGWMDDFRRLAELQRGRADEIIRGYCTMIGFQTAACPWKLADIFFVLQNSTMMVVELGKLYNRRIDRGAALRLILRWFSNIYISGELGRIGEAVGAAAGETLMDQIEKSVPGELLGTVGRKVVEGMPFVGKLGGKVAEGCVNALFAYRMGRQAIDAFQPLVSA